MGEPPTITVKGYKVDPMLFNHGFPKGCGPYQCDGNCCCDGVWVDLKEKDRILAEKDLIKKYMDDTQNKNHEEWFAEHDEDPDFPSGAAEGTSVHNNGCVFLNKDGLCVLQLAATKEGRHKWDIKPFYCVLFPVSVAEKTLTFDEHMEENGKSCCNIFPQFSVPMFRACKEEIVYAVGRGRVSRDGRALYGSIKNITQVIRKYHAMRFKGKIALVTGGVARYRAGDRAAVCGRRCDGRLYLQELEAAGG
jgi:Fe-S-cluster containining protein